MLRFLFFFLCCSGCLAQERVTDLDSLHREYYGYSFRHVKTEGDDLYLSLSNSQLYRYDLKTDSLTRLDFLPQTNTSLIVQNGEIYAIHYVPAEAAKYAYHFDKNKQALVRVNGAKLPEFTFLFPTAKGMLLGKDRLLLNLVFNGSAKPTLDTLSTSNEAFLQHGYPGHFFINTAGKRAVWDRGGVPYSMEFPALKEIQGIERDQDGGWIVKSKSSDKEGQSVYRIQGDKIEYLVDEQGEDTEAKYYQVEGKTIQVSYRKSGNKKVEMTLQEVKDGKATAIGKHSLNVYDGFHAVIFMPANAPTYLSYSREVLHEGKLYFLGNDALNMNGSGTASNLKLFCVDLLRKGIQVIDANAILNKDLFRLSNFMASGGYELKSEKEGLVVYPLKSSAEKHKKFVLKDSVLVPFSTVYDPRYFEETELGFFNAAEGILLDSGRKIKKELRYPVEVKERKKVEVPLPSDPFGLIVKTDAYLYLLNTEHSRPALSTFDKELKKHAVLQNFKEVSKVETLSLPGDKGCLVAVHGVTDTLNVSGWFIYYHDFSADQFTFLANSYRIAGIAKASVRERKGKLEVISSHFLLYTDLKNSTLFDNMYVVRRDEEGIIACTNRELVRFVDGQKVTLQAGVDAAYPVGEHIFLTLESGVALLTNGAYTSWEDARKEKRSVNVLSDKEVFFQFNQRFYLFNVESGRWKDLNIPWHSGALFKVYKVRAGFVIDVWNSMYKGYYFHDGRKTSSHPSAHYYSYFQQGQDVIRVESQYDVNNRRNIFRVSEWGGSAFTPLFSFARSTSLHTSLENSSDHYFKSLTNEKMYFWSESDQWFFRKELAFDRYEKIDILDKDLFLGTLSTGSVELLERTTEGIAVRVSELASDVKGITMGKDVYLIQPSGGVHLSKEKEPGTEEWFIPDSKSDRKEYRDHFTFKGEVFALGYAEQTGWQLYKVKGNTAFPDIFIHLYPNPVVSELNFRSTDPRAETFSISIRDSKGELEVEKRLSLPNKVDVSGLKQGIYFVKIQKGTFQKTWRIVKL